MVIFYSFYNIRNNIFYLGTKSVFCSIIQGRKAKFEENNGHFQYLYNIIKQ